MCGAYGWTTEIGYGGPVFIRGPTVDLVIGHTWVMELDIIQWDLRYNKKILSNRLCAYRAIQYKTRVGI